MEARRQQGGVSGGRVAAPARQGRGDNGAWAAAGRWRRRHNNKVGGRAREAATAQRDGGRGGGRATEAARQQRGDGGNAALAVVAAAASW